MSNHVIGYGINEVVETAVTMFEKICDKRKCLQENY